MNNISNFKADDVGPINETPKKFLSQVPQTIPLINGPKSEAGKITYRMERELEKKLKNKEEGKKFWVLNDNGSDKINENEAAQPKKVGQEEIINNNGKNKLKKG